MSDSYVEGGRDGVLDVVPGFRNPRGVSAVRPAIVLIVVFNAVPDDATSAPNTGRGERLDSAFEAIEGIGMTGLDNVERFVVPIVADSAGSHDEWISLVNEPKLQRWNEKGSQRGRAPG